MPDRKTRSLEAVLTEARKQFSSRRYDDVSINDIASAAQCSTTTIYDVYGSKKGLYDAAAQNHLIEISRTIDAAALGASTLECVISNLETRIEILAQPQSREAIRNMISIMGPDNIKSAPLLRNRLVEQFFMFADLLGKAMAEGDLRDMEPDIAADAMLAQTHWRPMFHGLVFGSNDPMNFDAANLTYRILRPFLSAKGEDEYRRLRPGITGAPSVAPKRPQ